MSKFFQSTKKGETHELKEELNSESKDKQKNAIKKVIASMTVGRDVSSLFADVTRLISTVSIDIKKLVYLYIMNNAKSQPEKAVLLAGSFVRDSQHDSPLIRGLAIRTMSAINVEKMADYLADPLKRALVDNDPYVRKTAAIAVAKMYTINRSKVEEGPFLKILQDMLCDSNPTVVSNAVAALTEIREISGPAGIHGASVDNDLAEFKPQTVHILLNALNETSEWGQVYIMEGLAGYMPKTADEADMIAERIFPRLQHGNAAVVLAGIKILVHYLETWGKRAAAAEREENLKKYCSKMAPPLLSLISGNQDFEIRYVALRNITLVCQQYPDVLGKQIKVFFVKYNDPIFIKLEKLDIILQLVDPTTVDICLSEFLEYASEVDIEFVRKSVRAIGRTAIKIDSATQKCIDVLLTLIKTKVNYVVQEGIIVIKDIFRKYPNQYESIIGDLCENLDTLDEPDAKAAMIWIIGEYAERIENADELLDMFIETFEEETIKVKLAILTAMVKLFLKRPDDTSELLQQVLKLASESDIPDLRDRGYVYWRLLSTDAEAAKEVVLCQKEVIDDTDQKYDLELLSELLMNIASLASVYHKPPSSFLADYLTAPKQPKPVYMEDEEDEEVEGEAEAPAQATEEAPAPAPAPAQEIDLLGDLDDMAVKKPEPSMDLLGDTASAATASSGDGFDDFFGSSAPAAKPAAPAVQRKTILTPEKGHGLQLDSAFTTMANGVLCMDLLFTNKSQQAVTGFALQLNKNVFGLAAGAKLEVPEPLLPGATHNAKLPLSVGGGLGPAVDIQIALKTNCGVAYFADQFPIGSFINTSAAVDKQEFLAMWKSIAQEFDRPVALSTQNEMVIQQKFEAVGVKFIAKRPGPPDHLYYACKTLSNSTILIELSLQAGQTALSLRSDATHLYQTFHTYLAGVLA